jgi:hypothetical protein
MPWTLRQPEPAVTGSLAALWCDRTWRPSSPRSGHRFPPVTGGRLVWPFRAQLPVRAAVPPEGAFSAQTPPARPFSRTRATFPASADDPSVTAPPGIATVDAQSPPCLTPTGAGCLPPACWPPGSPEGSWCRRGAMPGCQGRMSGTPPPRRSKPACHSPLTACPDHAPPATVGGGEGTRLRRVLLRWQAPQPCSTHRATRLTRARWRAGGPYVIPYVNPYVIPYALEVRTPGFAGRAHQCWSVPLRGGRRRQKNRVPGPPRGSGAAAPQGALRAFF